nr:hypothetical protein [uncultured Pseudodesulfovibrio sp.]
MARDFDLIAVSWKLEPVPPAELLRLLKERLSLLMVGDVELKLQGRTAYTLSAEFGDCILYLLFTPFV